MTISQRMIRAVKFFIDSFGFKTAGYDTRIQGMIWSGLFRCSVPEHVLVRVGSRVVVVGGQGKDFFVVIGGYIIRVGLGYLIIVRIMRLKIIFLVQKPMHFQERA